MKLDPNVPIVGKNTKITFVLKKLNNSISLFLWTPRSRFTITDSKWRLFKFQNSKIVYNKVFVNYIPGYEAIRVALQLYKNNTAFEISSFKIFVTRIAEGNFIYIYSSI